RGDSSLGEVAQLGFPGVRESGATLPRYSKLERIRAVAWSARDWLLLLCLRGSQGSDWRSLRGPRIRVVRERDASARGDFKHSETSAGGPAGRIAIADASLR